LFSSAILYKETFEKKRKIEIERLRLQEQTIRDKQLEEERNRLNMVNKN
jgi:hypothetical protein